MSKFPKTETDVMSLADQMCVGLANHAADFPSITPAQVGALQETLESYRNYRVQQETAKGQAQIATVTKDQSFDELTTLMKNALKKAETDTVADPQKLYEIGWGPRQAPQPIIAPGSPTELHPIAEGQGTIWLAWNKPETGGPVWNYIIERRQQAQTGGDFGPWTLANTTYNCEINLADQPVNARLEYRVKAANSAGESLPSNSVSVVLP
jgi:hypothetical protein